MANNNKATQGKPSSMAQVKGLAGGGVDSGSKKK